MVQPPQVNVNAKCDVVMKLSIFGTRTDTHTHRAKPIHPRYVGCNHLSDSYVAYVGGIFTTHMNITEHRKSSTCSELTQNASTHVTASEKLKALHCMPLTNYFGEFLHNVVLALALRDVAHKKTTVWYGWIHLQLLARSDLVSIQL